MLTWRSAAVAALLAAVGIMGCAGLGDTKPVQAYAGAERPVDQVGILECGFGLRVKSIDGDSRYKGEPITCKFALLPGKHELRVGFESRDYSAQGTWRSAKDYLISLELQAGRKYSLHAFLDEKKKEGFPWRVTLLDSSRKDLIMITNVREAP